jgi:transposase, IS30 family
MAKKGKHLTLDQRMEIQYGLKRQLRLVEIAFVISKDPRTVSCEIKRNLIRLDNDKCLFVGQPKTTCARHERYPFVCDGCQKKRSCLSDHYSYDAKRADELYHTTLVHSRSGINLTMNELSALNSTLLEGVRKGQSVEHIVSTHPEINYSVRSIYRHISTHALDTKPYHLRRMPKLKKRVPKVPKQAEPCFIEGRTIMDYLSFTARHPGLYTTQIDTVHGKMTDHKVILTIVIIELHFFYAVVLNQCDAHAVVSAFEYLYGLLGHTDFNRLFPIMLTDRGSEFSRPHDIELTTDLKDRTKIFYCDPLASYQKGAIESIHRILRYVFPKGKSIDFLTQKQLDVVISSINSYRLRSNQFVTAYELMKQIFGEDVLIKLKVRAIDPDQIHLTPALVK